MSNGCLPLILNGCIAAQMCRFCKAVHTAPNRYKCKPCHNGFCWPCILRRFYIHPIIALADDDADKFHAMHRGDNRRDYEQWSSSPSRETSRHGHYTLVRAAISNPLCRPLDARCRLGFIDDLWAPGNVVSCGGFLVNNVHQVTNKRAHYIKQARVSTTVTTPTLTPTPKREIPHRSSKRAVEANGISIPDSAVRVDGSVKRPRRSSPKRKVIVLASFAKAPS